MTRKLAIVATHPIQYHAPVWKLLSHDPELDVHLYYGSDFSVRTYRDSGMGVAVAWDTPLLDGYTHTFLTRSVDDRDVRGFLSLRPAGLGRLLRDRRPDCALILGYMPFFWWEALFFVRSLGIPAILRAEATDKDNVRGAAKRCARDAFLRLFYGQCDRFLAIGRNAREHYLDKGVDPARIGWSPYCANTDLLEAQYSRYMPMRDMLREQHGIGRNDLLFVYSGKLIPKKDPMTLAKALAGLPEDERRSVWLVVMGDGELRNGFEAECRKSLGERAIFAGFVNQSRLGSWYAACDCMILPSAWGETWGVVVNEALQFGLPVIASDRVGAGADLVVEGETGWIFPAGDSKALSARMVMVKRLLEDRDATASRCRDRVAGYSTREAARGIKEASLTL